MNLTEQQLSLQHILGTGRAHEAWHSSFPNGPCHYCETLEDLATYINGV